MAPGTAVVIPPARRVRGEPMVQTERTNRLTVLLANEQEGWHQTIRGLLEPQGVQTISARSGREALDLIETRPVHVAVLDQRSEERRVGKEGRTRRAPDE